MKIKGTSLQGPNVSTVVIPRTDGRPDIIFKFQAIMDDADFTKLVPETKLAMRMKRGGTWEVNYDDETYKKQEAERREKLRGWEFVKSSAVTPGLSWERVDLNKPDTWPFYEQELREAGFSTIEIGRLWGGFYEANCLDNGKVKEARDRFLLQEAAAQMTSETPGSSSPAGQASTPSSAPASASASSPQA